MRSLLITLTAGGAALLLSGCPDMPGAPAPAIQSETRAPQDSSPHAGGGHHVVSEIAWFQGTIDEAFSHRRCSESHPRRMLFRF
jgi:hypothetical protein